MSGVGSGNWYRFDRKTTTGECQSVDVRYLHREGLLTPGHWFSLRWSRAGRETGSIRGVVIGDEKPERMILTYRHRTGPSGEWKDVREPVPLSWTACNFGGERPCLSVPERAAAAGLRFCTGRGATSCAVIATTSVTKARGRMKCTVLFAGRRRFERGSEGART